MAEPIRLHQAVFGYREGHNLLVASVELAPKARHFLATMTDASGPDTAPEFVTAYTGLPVPETDYYAVFCTWSAPEMPRPGCVWSHVLLVELADLARIEDLSVLRRFFRRPSGSAPVMHYEEPLILCNADAPGSIGVPRGTEAILEALYKQPDTGVVVLAENSKQWESTVFAIWTQQWPRLRRNFAFSTGSLGDRRMAGAAFDLQIAPINTERLWRRSTCPTTVIETESTLASALEQGWLRIALNDLGWQNPGNLFDERSQFGDKSVTLREFLCKYGSDLGNPRHAFIPILTAYQWLFGTPEKTWDEKLRAVGRILPAESDAVRLKEWLVIPPSTPGDQESLERAWATAAFLLAAPEAVAYSKISVNLSKWAKYLWQKKRDDVLSLFGRLVRQPEKPATTAFATGIAEALVPADLPYVASRNPEVVPIFVSHRPVLAHHPTTWGLPTHLQWQIYEALETLAMDAQEWSKIEGAMFIAATNVAVKKTVKKAGQHAMEGAFLWLESKVARDLLPAQNWREALAEPATAIMAQGRPLSPAQLALCAWIVPADAARSLLTASRQDVQELAKEFRVNIPAPLQLHTAFLLVTLGLKDRTGAGVAPLVKAFFEVHDALANLRFSSESWQLLSPELPRLRVWQNWDQCEKLRRTVRDWLLEHASSACLVEAADTEERRKLVAHLFRKHVDPDEFLD